MLNIKWEIVKLAVRESLEWSKKNWKFILGFSIPIALTVVFNACNDDIKKVYTQLLEDDKKEAKIIKDSDDELEDQKEKAKNQHEERVEEIKEAHKEAQIELTDEKEKEIERLVEKYHDDPEGLTEKLSEISGIRIVVE